MSGIVAALLGDWPILGTGWILWGIVMLVISGAAFGMRVAPLQRELARLAGEAGRGAGAQARFREVYGSWQLWGTVAPAHSADTCLAHGAEAGSPGIVMSDRLEI